MQRAINPKIVNYTQYLVQVKTNLFTPRRVPTHKQQQETQISRILCLGFRASYVNIYKENQLDAV